MQGRDCVSTGHWALVTHVTSVRQSLPPTTTHTHTHTVWEPRWTALPRKHSQQRQTLVLTLSTSLVRLTHAEFINPCTHWTYTRTIQIFADAFLLGLSTALLLCWAPGPPPRRTGSGKTQQLLNSGLAPCSRAHSLLARASHMTQCNCKGSWEMYASRCLSECLCTALGVGWDAQREREGKKAFTAQLGTRSWVKEQEKGQALSLTTSKILLSGPLGFSLRTLYRVWRGFLYNTLTELAPPHRRRLGTSCLQRRLGLEAASFLVLSACRSGHT